MATNYPPGSDSKAPWNEDSFEAPICKSKVEVLQWDGSFKTTEVEWTYNPSTDSRPVLLNVEKLNLYDEEEEAEIIDQIWCSEDFKYYVRENY